MPTKNHIESREIEELEARADGKRSEPEGRAQRAGGGAVAADPSPLPGLPGGGLLERPELSDELIDELLAGATSAEEIAGPEGLLGQLTRRLLERALEAEITEHLGYPAGQAPPGGAGNARNGQPPKTGPTHSRPARGRPPRARKGPLWPQMVGKGPTRRGGLDARG